MGVPIYRQYSRSRTQSTMASNPPGKCCYQGVKHEGNATGEISTLGDFEIYTKYPENKSTEKGILIITDVIGHRFINAQLIADQFAANGCFVVMPDLFHGDPIPLNRPGDFDIMKWIQGEYNEKKIAHLRPDAGKIDAGYTAHPSFVEGDELRDVKGPLAIAAAETDAIFPTEKRHETEQILKDLGLPYQINLYSGVEHGFAVRGDPEYRVGLYAKENAFLQAVQWFEEHLK